MSGFVQPFSDALTSQFSGDFQPFQSVLAGGNTPLVLGSFTFLDAYLETPEALGDLGGTQSVSSHSFPGGTITQKSFGYFPAEMRWRGHFHSPNASDRKEALKRIMVAGEEVTLTWGPRSWVGRVTKFVATVKHAWLYDYELDFCPRQDQSAGLPIIPFPGLGSILALHVLALQSLIKYGLDPAFIGEAAALAIGGPAGAVLLQVQSLVYGAGGSIGGISNNDKQSIFQSTVGALAACAPYQASDNPALSSPASDAASRLQAIQTIMSAAAPPVTVIHTINPNLLVLAAQYYGDATLWQTIANANGLSDPQPIGSFNLIIPPTSS